jgi:hypothetical protein
VETGTLGAASHRYTEGLLRPVAKVCEVAQYFNWQGAELWLFCHTSGTVLTAANIYKKWIGKYRRIVPNRRSVYVVNDADAAGLAEMTLAPESPGVVILDYGGTGREPPSLRMGTCSQC